MKVREHRVFGPPGCGKTSYASRQARLAAEKYGPDRVMITSFSRTAAREIAGRDLGGVNASTLHAHCWHGLDRPPIAELHIAENHSKTEGLVPWNRVYPNHALTAAGLDVEAGLGESGATEGDKLMAKMQQWRGALLPQHLWPEGTVRHFARLWEDWKQQQGLVDFADMIDLAYAELPVAPGNPAVALVDEAQDLTPASLRLVRAWAENMEHLVVIGDDDQTLYSWTGCDPEAFLTPPIPPEQMLVLKQSYRVPRAVHARALTWIEQVSVRQPKTYHPRDAEGRVLALRDPWTRPQPLLPKLEREIAEGRTVMVIASCAYMLAPLLGCLREAGLPFHNPFREKAGHWNPLRSGRGTSASQRLLAFIQNEEAYLGERARMWTWAELASYAEPLRSEGVFLRGAKAEIERRKATPGLATWDDLATFFTDAALEALFMTDLGWYEEHLLAARAKAFGFPLRILRKRGIQALVDTPRVVVGTIHSVKGAESDCVICYPDLSQVAYHEGWTGPKRAQDDLRRLFYVAMTRARDTLVIADPAGQLAVRGL